MTLTSDGFAVGVTAAVSTLISGLGESSTGLVRAVVSVEGLISVVCPVLALTRKEVTFGALGSGGGMTISVTGFAHFGSGIETFSLQQGAGVGFGAGA